MYKPNFCYECCTHFIGSIHAIERENCKFKCRNQIYEHAFEDFAYDYVMKVPLENKIERKTVP